MDIHTPKSVIVFLIIASIVGGIFGNYQPAAAAIVYDQTAGLYTDDFADATGVAASTNAGVDVVDGTMKLKNALGDFAPDYSVSGTVTLQLIRPTRVAEWGILSIVASTPANTSIKVQALDDHGTPFKDEFLSGNEAGLSSFPVDFGSIPVLQCADPYFPGDGGTADDFTHCTRYAALYLKFTLTTSDTDETPSIDSMQFTYAVTQGDLTASPFATAPWAAFAGTQQGTHHSLYHNATTYPAFRWASASYEGGHNIEGRIYGFANELFGTVSGDAGYMLGLDKENGSESWRLPYSAHSSFYGTFSQNGTFYGTDVGSDYFYAVDAINGQIKWTYYFGGGHGNNSTVIGSDGTIFTIRNNVGLTDTVYAFNPNGTIKWTKTITAASGTTSNPSPFAVGQDGTLYYSTTVLNAGNANLDLGKLHALDPADGTVKWSYDIGDASGIPLVDAFGTIYVGNYYFWAPWNPLDPNKEEKLWAINTDGTLKWSQSLGTGDRGVNGMSLRSDGNLWLRYEVGVGSGTSYKVVSYVDGSVIFDDLSGQSVYATPMISDNVDGFYNKDADQIDIHDYSTLINYRDTNGNLKWQISYSYDSSVDPFIYSYAFAYAPIIGENGWFYSGLSKSVYDSSLGYAEIPSQEFAQFFALAPWTLSLSTTPGAIYRDGTITFSVTTSMQQTNPLTNEANQMQVVLDDSTKIPLVYSSTNGDGNTVWTADYTVPADAAFGAHSYTVEANAALVKTDIAVAFASPATNTDNTGLTAVSTYVISRNGTAPISLGGSSSAAPSLAVNVPRAGATYDANAVVGLDWTSSNAIFTRYKISYSADNGSTWGSIGETTVPALSWAASDLGTTSGLIKVEGYGASGTILATGTSGNFTILGEVVPDEDNGAVTPPATDPTVSGVYTANKAKENNPSFNTTMGLTSPPAGTTVYCTAGELIKGSLPSVYYCGADGKRYVFVNDKAFFSWYSDFSTVITISDADLAKIPLGGNITYRPGSRMIKIQTDPKVYAVARGGILRWVTTEAIAVRLYGTNWNTMIDDVPDSFFVNYTVGEAIAE